MFVTNTCVRNLFDAGFRNFSADRIGLLAVTNFLDHASAGDGSHFRAGNPASAGDGSAGLFAGDMAAAGFVDAFAVQRVPFPVAGATDTLLHDWTRHLFRFCHPVTSTDGDFFRLTNWLADGVANITIQCLCFGAVGRAADFAIFCFANRLADGATDVAITGLETGLADRAANIFVVSLHARFADRATDVFVAGLEAGLLHCAADVFVAGLIDRLADRVAFVAVARFVNISRASDRNLLGAGFVNRPATIHGSLFVDSFANGLITHSAESLR